MVAPPVLAAVVTATAAQPAASAGGFLATNSAEGGTSGTAVTTANTGGTSGVAFTAVNIGSGATYAPSNTRAAHGTLSYQVATVASANSYVTWTAPGAMPPQAWFRMYLYVTANPASAFRLVTYLQGATRCAYVQLGTGGQLQFIDHASVTMCATTAAVPLNAWFRVEGYLVGSVAAGQAELRLYTTMDGITPAETDTSAAGQATAGVPNAFSFGPFTAASIGPYWIDDLGISTSGYLGPPGSAIITPAFLAATAGFPAPAVTGSAVAAPATLTAGAAVLVAAVTGNSATVTPATLAAGTVVPAPVVRQDQTITPATAAVTAGFPAATAHGNTVTPATVTATAAQPAASAGGFLAANTAAGGTSGTTVTTANTGGTSGTAFTAVNIGSGATFAFDSTQAVHTPAMSYKVATVASANAYVTWTAPAAMPAQSWFRAYLYVTANPAAAFRLVTFLNGAARCAYLQLGTTGQLQFIDHASVTMCQTAASVPLSQWFRVEGYLTGSATTGQAELRLFTVADGLLPAETGTSSAAQNTVGAANGFSLGPFTAASIGPYWMDDLGVSSSGYMGPTQPVANPPVVAAAAGFPACTVTVTTASANATPGTVQATVTVSAPAVEQDQTIPAATVTGTAGFPQASTGVAATAAPLTVTATVTTRTGWVEAGRVGVYLSGGIGTGGTGVPFTTASTLWQSWTGTSVPAARYYLPLSNFSYQTSMQQMVAAGTKICLTIRPAYNPVSSTDLASLATLLQTLKAAGAIVDVALWHEPYYQGLTSAQFLAMWAYYAPTVRAYYPTVFVPNVASLAAHGEGAYYPGDTLTDKVCADIYDSQYLTGQNLTAAQAIADGASPPKPFGVWEFDGSTDPYNGQSQANVTAFFTYIQTFMAARLSAGKTNADILLFPSLQSNWLGNVSLPNAGMTGGIGNWAPYTSGNCTTTATVAQVHSPGTGAMAMTSVAAGAMTAYCALGAASGQPVTAGTSVIGLQAWFRAATSARTCQVNVIWYTAAGTLLSTSSGTASTSTTSGWTQLTLSGVTAPATAAFALPQVQVNGTGAAGEVHYVTDVNLWVSAAASPAQCNVLVFGWDYRIGLWETLYAALNAAPSVGSGVSVFPATLTATTAVPAPVVRQDQNAIPATVAVTSTRPAVAASGSATVTASILAATITAPTPTVAWMLAGTAPDGSVTAGGLGQVLALTGSTVPAPATSGTLTWQTTTSSGTAVTVTAAAGTLTWQVPVTGTAGTGTAAAGTLAGQVPVTGTAVTGTAAGPGTLTWQAALPGTAVTVTVTAGTFTGQTALAGATVTAAATAGTLTWQAALTGTAVTADTTAGTLTWQAALTVTAVSVTSSTGTLAGTAAMAGTATTSTVTAADSTSVMVVPGGTASTGTVAAGALAWTVTLAAAAATTTTTAGTLTAGTTLSGTAVTVTAAAGNAAGLGTLGLLGSTPTATITAGTLTQAMAVRSATITPSPATGTFAGQNTLAGTAPLTSVYTGVYTDIYLPQQATAGTVTVTTPLTGAVVTVTVTAGAVTATVSATGTAPDGSVTAGTFTQAMTAAGATTGTTVTAGTLTWAAVLTATTAAPTITTGAMAAVLITAGTAATPTATGGAVTGAAALTGTTVPLTATAGTLGWSAVLTGTTVTATTGTGTPGRSAVLTAAATITATATAGTLAGSTTPAGTATTLTVTAGTFTALAAISGTAVANIPGVYTGTYTGTYPIGATTTGALTWTAVLTGTGTTVTTGTGTLAWQAPVTGTAVTVTITAGTATTTTGVTGAAVTVTVTTGGFTVAYLLSMTAGQIIPQIRAARIIPQIRAAGITTTEVTAGKVSV